MELNLLNYNKIQDYVFQDLEPALEVFLDEQFPPVKEKSLYTKKGSKLSGEQKVRYRSEFMYFKRAYEIFPEEEFLLLKDVSPLDPMQGDLPNSYFIAALSSLAVKPDRVRRLFKNKISKDKGYYSL